MSEYIDKAEALSRFENLKKQADTLRDKLYIDGVLAIIDTLPSADVRPVVHGMWVYKGFEKGWECSACGSRCLLNYESDFHKSDFCPHCGADMRKDEKEQAVELAQEILGPWGECMPKYLRRGSKKED